MPFHPYLLHPMLVHFPIALLASGWAANVVFWRRPAWVWAEASAGAALLAGWVGLGVALSAGYLAERTAPHVPPAWEVLADHKSAAWSTLAYFTLFGWAYLKWPRWRAGWGSLFWAVGLGLLVWTAHLGATLVFSYGMGSPPG